MAIPRAASFVSVITQSNLGDARDVEGLGTRAGSGIPLHMSNGGNAPSAAP
jgi:hypothetical protein